MTAATLQAVAELEQECFSKPWSLDGLRAELSNPLAVFYTARLDDSGDTGLAPGGSVGYAACMPCCALSRIVGYAGMYHILDEGQITNIAVSGRFRRMGAASALIRALFAYGRENGLRTITLEVRPSNTEAIAMYEKFGFRREGGRKNFYSAPAEDALILTASL